MGVLPSADDLDGGIELERVGIGHRQHDVPSSWLGLGDLGDEQGRAVTATELPGVVVRRELDFVAQSLKEPGRLAPVVGLQEHGLDALGRHSTLLRRLLAVGVEVGQQRLGHQRRQ
jgi:hypothetical protein